MGKKFRHAWQNYKAGWRRSRQRLDEPADPDLEDQAIELEDDEVLESVGRAGLKEIGLLNAALTRIEKGTYGICTKCGQDIADASLDAVPFALLCRECAKAVPQGPV
ncbi:TraR/DksA C4-type zinc finger protein [uncultured Boseongicola sp.]|uniref:TraR/DksA family transcriptional regulator n=1 Tax=uncultured Boseongicola sp. TaxID=1648499 RepID=UPI00342BE9A2